MKLEVRAAEERDLPQIRDLTSSLSQNVQTIAETLSALKEV